MKKLWTALTCLLLVGVLAALSACGGVQSDGSVPGDYRSVTVAEAVQALEAVGAESPLGDPSAEGWSFGAKGRAEASVTAEQGSASLEAEARSEMQLSIGAGEQDELIFLLACENSAEAHGSLADDAAADAAARANVYIDGENLYLDIGAEASAGGAADSSSYKKKIPLDLGIPSLPQIPGAAEAAGCSRPVPCRSTPPESSITTTQAAASRAEARGTRALRRTGTAQSLRWMRETIRSST